MKRQIAMVLLCILLAILTSCGSKEATAAPAEQTIPETTEAFVETLPPETTAPVTEPATESITEEEAETAEDLQRDLRAGFDMALAFVVEGEELTPADKISNAILHTIRYEILSASDGICVVTVFYPDAYNSFASGFHALPQTATEEEVFSYLEKFALSLENGEVPMLEETFAVDYVMKEGIATILWTEQLYNAFSGGFYSALDTTE